MKKTAWPVCPKTEPIMTSLIKLSHFFGADPKYVLAGGGNVSIKSEDRLWVKASGHALATIQEDGFVELDRSVLAETLLISSKQDPRKREGRFTEMIMSSRIDTAKGQRPSVESVLHHLLPSVFVIHLHPTSVNMLTCTVNGEKYAKRWFGKDTLWISICEPGLILAQKIDRALQSYRRSTGRAYPASLLLQNHGLIICGDTPAEIRKNTEYVMNTLKRRIGKIPAAPFGRQITAKTAKDSGSVKIIHDVLSMVLAKEGTPATVVHDDSEFAMKLVRAVNGKKIAVGGPLSPDQIVYCSSFPLWVKLPGKYSKDIVTKVIDRELKQYRAKYSNAPMVILVEGVGLFTAGEQPRQAETARQLYLDAIKVMAGACRINGIYPMPRHYRRFIETWEVEAYRRQIAKKS